MLKIMKEKSALMIAIDKNDSKIIEYLIEKGANKN